MSTKSPEDPVLPKLVNGGQYASLEDALEDAPEDPCVCSEDPALDPPVSTPHCNCRPSFQALFLHAYTVVRREKTGGIC